MFQNQKNVSQDLQNLATKVLEFGWNIASALLDTATHPSETLVRNVGQLLNALERILDDLKFYSSRGRLSRLLRARSDVARVKLIEEDLERAIILFVNQTQLANQSLSASLAHLTIHQQDEFEAAIQEVYQQTTEFVLSPVASEVRISSSSPNSISRALSFREALIHYSALHHQLQPSLRCPNISSDDRQQSRRSWSNFARPITPTWRWLELRELGRRRLL